MTSAHIEVGSLLADRYRIEAVLGVGGMSTVYRARDESLARSVAIKVFRESLTDAAAVQRQRSEVQLIASFEHPSLVTLYDAVVLDNPESAGTNDGEHAFIVMQFVDGHDLGEELSNGALPESRMRAIGADIADALATVHERGVIHRDVKPGNILLPTAPRSSGPQALLADFGIARFLDGLALTATGAVLGTANYLSPEQALGRELSTATDVYSLGLVLVEALSGERAFPGVGMEAVAARLSTDPQLPGAASDELRSLLAEMTLRDAARRPSAADVAARLRGRGAAAAAGAGYAPTVLLPAATDAMSGAVTEAVTEAETEAMAEAPVAAVHETRHVSRPLVAAAVVIVLVLIGAVVAAIALPHSSPTSVSTPVGSLTPSRTPAPSSSSSVTTTTAPVVQVPAPVATPTVTTVTPPGNGGPSTDKPGTDKPGKDGNGKGNGHGKKP